MSTINRKPIIATIINGMAAADKTALLLMLDGAEETIFRSLVNQDDYITSDDEGIAHVELETQDRLMTGYLIYNTTGCWIIAYKEGTQMLDIAKINLTKMAYSFIEEYLDINELRNALTDIGDAASIARLREDLNTLNAEAAKVYTFDDAIENLDANAMMEFYLGDYKVLEFDVENDHKEYLYLTYKTETMMIVAYPPDEANGYTYIKMERAATDSPWAITSTDYVVLPTTSNVRGIIEDGDLDLDGDFTADSIIENMEGYSYSSVYLGSTYEITPLYVGAVKTGNKVTFAVTFTIKRVSDTIDNYFPVIASVTIPNSIWNSLYPTTGNMLESKVIPLVTSESDTSPKNKVGVTAKASSNQLYFVLGRPYDLTLNELYYGRFETTFLLGENLASTNP